MTIADSSAVKDDRRLLTQHQAALTLLQASLADPAISRVHWLDLACGRGQIIIALQDNFSAAERAKLIYYAFDADQRYLHETARTAQRLGFADVRTKVGNLADFARLVDSETLFDFVTFTNTAHEVRPVVLAQLLVDVILRLASRGCLFMYDMEYVNPPELGAIPWSSAEFVDLMQSVMDAFGINNYSPAIGRWRHSSTVGWNLQLHRHHLGIDSPTASAARDRAVAALSERMRHLLRAKLSACTDSLESITCLGPETPEEDEAKVRQLYDFWSLKRALESENG
jgi:hypothetical protein